MNDPNQDIRWKQRFRNFDKTYALLERTLTIKSPSEAERAGLIQFFNHIDRNGKRIFPVPSSA